MFRAIVGLVIGTQYILNTPTKNVSCSSVKCEFVTNGKWEWLTPPLTMKTAKSKYFALLLQKSLVINSVKMRFD